LQRHGHGDAAGVGVTVGVWAVTVGVAPTGGRAVWAKATTAEHARHPTYSSDKLPTRRLRFLPLALLTELMPADLGERANVAARHPEVVRELGAALKGWNATLPTSYLKGAGTTRTNEVGRLLRPNVPAANLLTVFPQVGGATSSQRFQEAVSARRRNQPRRRNANG
jgi:hypothetical protein